MTFLTHAKHLQNLFKIKIRNNFYYLEKNKITEIKQGYLESFNSLETIQFSSYNGLLNKNKDKTLTNPLSVDSIKILTDFNNKHKP